LGRLKKFLAALEIIGDTEQRKRLNNRRQRPFPARPADLAEIVAIQIQEVEDVEMDGVLLPIFATACASWM